MAELTNAGSIKNVILLQQSRDKTSHLIGLKPQKSLETFKTPINGFPKIEILSDL